MFFSLSAFLISDAKKGMAVCHPFFVDTHPVGLDDLDVFCLPALGTLGHIELDALAFLKRTETVRLDGGVMNENVFAIFTAQKTKTLGVIKPLDCALFHDVAPLDTDLPHERNVEVFASRR